MAEQELTPLNVQQKAANVVVTKQPQVPKPKVRKQKPEQLFKWYIIQCLLHTKYITFPFK